jgi:phosphoserine phosphatase RsbU/P
MEGSSTLSIFTARIGLLTSKIKIEILIKRRILNSPDSNYILCVDDDPVMLKLISIYLDDIGLTSQCASNGQDALKILKKSRPNLVLTDLNMPIMDGLELIAKIKELYPNMPVLVISGEQDMSEAINALQSGAWDYIVKPFTKNTLEQSICNILEKFRLIDENIHYRFQLEKKNAQLKDSLNQLESDQIAGKSIQQLLLPESPTHFKEYTFSHKVTPSLYLSGDFVDYFKIDDNRIGFYIVDISGHGASSAFVTVLVRGFIEQLLAQYGKGSDDSILHPNKLFKKISEQILNAKLGKYLTMIYGILDSHQNTLLYSIGGHYPNPILWDGLTATFLKGNGFPLGVHKAAQFENICSELPKYFSLVIFSDGVFEILKGENLEQNEAKLLEFVTNTSSIDDMLISLGIQNKEGFPDDITLLMMNKNNTES